MELARLGVLTPVEADTFRRPVGFRNVLVHGYLKVNREYVARMFHQKRYRDILATAGSILEYASKHGVDP